MSNESKADISDTDERDIMDHYTPLEEDAHSQINDVPQSELLKDLSSYNAKKDKTGIIYLSRIPPGMGPSKVRHILSQYGKIGRVYLQRKDAPNGNQVSKKKADKHHSHNFTEGWVEFYDKKLARHVAELLNARTIGGKKSSRWRDDVWTMKYLPKFKWSMLSEQVAHEASVQQSILRQHISQSKRDQASYLRQVDRASAIERTQKRKREQEEIEEINTEESKLTNRLPKGQKLDEALQETAKKAREFRQRRPIQKGKVGNNNIKASDTTPNNKSNSETLQSVLALL